MQTKLEQLIYLVRLFWKPLYQTVIPN